MKPKKTNINEILDTRHVVVCVGAGGVGKTTIAAALAVHAARAGRRVVCLTIDPARRLADSLGVSPADSGTIKDISHILGEEVGANGSLSFGMLNPKETFARIIHERASSKEAADRILDNSLYRYVSGSLSGMQEYMALEQLLTIRNDDSVDLIVLDTPPTANAMDFFTAPSRMTEALDGRLVRIMRTAYRGPAGTGIGLWGRWTSILLRALSKFTGLELLGEMMAFVDALSDLFGSFAERARAIERILHDDEVAFCLVTAAEKSTLTETLSFKDRLEGLDLHIDAVVFNQTHWPRAGTPPLDLQDSTRKALAAITDEWNELSEIEDGLIEEVDRALGARPVAVRVPVLPEEANALKSLKRIGGYF